MGIPTGNWGVLAWVVVGDDRLVAHKRTSYGPTLPASQAGLPQPGSGGPFGHLPGALHGNLGLDALNPLDPGQVRRCFQAKVAEAIKPRLASSTR
jgi:hypothetical protein